MVPNTKSKSKSPDFFKYHLSLNLAQTIQKGLKARQPQMDLPSRTCQCQMSVKFFEKSRKNTQDSMTLDRINQNWVTLNI